MRPDLARTAAETAEQYCAGARGRTLRTDLSFRAARIARMARALARRDDAALGENLEGAQKSERDAAAASFLAQQSLAEPQSVVRSRASSGPAGRGAGADELCRRVPGAAQHEVMCC